MPKYGEYSLDGIPRNALPQPDRFNKGKHSYSVCKGGKIIEVLLRSQAYYVRGDSDNQECRGAFVCNYEFLQRSSNPLN